MTRYEQAMLGLGGLFLVACQTPVCGDGVLNDGTKLFDTGTEACDDGNAEPADGCGLDCTINKCGDGAAQPGELCFSPKGAFTVDGTTPNFIRHGDFNGDGFLDLAVVSQDTQSLSVLRNDGQGGFPGLEITDFGAATRDLAIGDFNGDGLDDLATGRADLRAALLFISRGDGTFDPPQTLDTIMSAAFLVAADAEGDGDLDLFADGTDLVTGADSITILRNQGGGVFGAPENTSAAQRPFGFVARDLNNDGRADLAVANPLDDQVRIFRGEADNSLFPLVTEPTGTQPEQVFSATIDDDAEVDLLVLNKVSGDLSVLIGQGTGVFNNEKRFTAGGPPLELALGDLNKDGRQDIFVRLLDRVQVMFGQSGFLFEAPSDVLTEKPPLAIDVADLNNDGFADLVLAIGSNNPAVQPSVAQILLAKP